ncbi:MAG: glycosyltransferase [Pseudonocardiaceae bacterium]
MDHVILTRFNLPSKGPESVIRTQPGWLRSRVGLFETYCLPSMLAQTTKSYRWLIYFDPQSPDWLRSWIEEHVASGHFISVFRAEVTGEELAGDIGAPFETPGKELITTNLDNDDALAHDFVERLQTQPSPSSATVYYFSTGLIKSAAGVYRRYDRHNAFPSVREPWSERLRTCWADWHNHLPRHMEVVEIGGHPGWLQVVHDNNVTNRIRGTLVSPADYRPLFGNLLDDVETPSNLTLAQDYLINRPLRITRDSGIHIAKTVLLSVGGRAGFDRVKQVIAARVVRRKVH